MSLLRNINIIIFFLLALNISCSGKKPNKSILVKSEQSKEKKTVKKNKYSKQVKISEKQNSQSDPASGNINKDIPSDMLIVKGGKFIMGLNHKRAIKDEMHEHPVTVKSFLLDITEVTNGAYKKCVDTRVCRPPKKFDYKKHGFEDERFFKAADHPVTGVSQKDAITYCRWLDKRLPTEAEFERAARGDDQRLYPWGNNPPTEELAVYSKKATAKVASCKKGRGPYGHYDLSGNVWEWTSDLYDPFAYERKDGKPADCKTIKKAQDQLRREHKQGYTGTNPIPKGCDTVLRGGAFNYFPWGLRSSNRVHHPATWKMIMAGFRCAKDL